VRQGQTGTGTLWKKLTTHSVPLAAHYFALLGITAYYIHSKTHFHLLKDADLRYISRVQYGVSLFPFGPVNDQDIIKDVFMTKHQYTHLQNLRPVTISAILRKEISLNHTKVSARHLRHVTVNELRALDETYVVSKIRFLEYFISRLVQHPDFTEAFFAGLVVWILNMPDELYQYVSSSKVWYKPYIDVLSFASYVKNTVTLRLKALQNCLSIDLTPCFEFEVLVNRGLGTVDWAAEKDHRVNPNVCNIDSNTVYRKCGELFSRLLRSGHKPTKKKWDNHWKMRWKWAPAGTFFSQYEEDDEFKAADSTLRNKIFAMSRMPHYPISHFIDRNPEVQAKAMTKYEWGKQRAIYGVDNTCFILSQYGFGDCESLLSNVFPIGKSATTENVALSVQNVIKNGTPFCFDFEDFNSQHSTVTMQMVLVAYRDVFSHYLDPDQVTAINWQIAALDDVTVLDKLGGRYKAKGTLLSGWRMTTFINTVLNKIYIDSCLDGQLVPTLHNGDDVLAAVTNLHQVQVLMRGAASLNIRFQSHKCFLGAIAEFLRVDHKQKVGGQYLARAVSTYVHGPTESIVPNDIIAVVKSLSVRKKEILERRGRPAIMDRLSNAQCNWLTTLWGLEPGSINIIMNTHVSLGGISEEVSELSLSHRIERVPDRRSFDPGGKLAADMGQPLPGAYAYAVQVTSLHGLEHYCLQVYSSVKKSIFATTIMSRFTVIIKEIDGTSRGREVLDANQYGMFRGQIDNVKTLLSKAFKIPLFEFTRGMSAVIESLRYTFDPLGTLVLWT